MVEQEAGVQSLVRGTMAYRKGAVADATLAWEPLLTSEDALVRAFARALLSNVAGEADGLNLYDPESKQTADQIELFSQLGLLPFIRDAHQAAAMTQGANAVEGSVLLDLGCGTGMPAESIVVASRGRIKHVIAVDLDPSSVAATIARVRGVGAGATGISVPFEQIDWEGVVEFADGAPFAVHAGFALHHLDLDGKRSILERVAGLTPHVFTLVEPNSSHWDADLLVRLLHALSHFRAVQRAITESEIVASAQEQVLEFFAREVKDIMGDSPARFERHESWLFWYHALLDSGFSAVDIASDAPGTRLLPGAVNLTGGGAHLVTTFAFTS